MAARPLVVIGLPDASYCDSRFGSPAGALALGGGGAAVSGWRCDRFRWVSSDPMIASCVSERLRLNSRIPFPIEEPTSGSRLAPKRSSTTTMINMISVKPRLPTGTP